MSQRKVILKNFLLMTVAAPLSSGISFLLTVIIARSLRARGFGIYSQIFGMVSIFQVFIESFRAIIIRDISQEPERLHEIFGVAKTFLLSISIILPPMLIVGLKFSQGVEEISLSTILMACIGAIALFHAMGLGMVFMAFENMEYNAIGSVGQKIIALILVGLVVLKDPSLFNVFGALAIANFSMLVFYKWIFHKRYGYSRIVFVYQKLKKMAKEIFIVGSIAFLRRLFWNVDVFLLSWMSSVRAAGIFNGAYNIIFSLNMIPWIGSLAFLPQVSRMAAHEDKNIILLTKKTMILFYLVSIPVIFVASPHFGRVVTFLLGPAYSESAGLMRILIWDLLLSLPISMLFYIFTSLNRQSTYFYACLCGLITKVGLNLMFIPSYGAKAGVISSISGDFVWLFILFVFLHRGQGRVKR